MAKELDTELSGAGKKDVKSESKPDNKKEKADNKKAAAQKPKKSIVKYFKDAKSEFKKVSWPTPTQVARNTTVVMTMIIGSMLALWGIDSVFLAVLRFAFQMD